MTGNCTPRRYALPLIVTITSAIRSRRWPPPSTRRRALAITSLGMCGGSGRAVRRLAALPIIALGMSGCAPDDAASPSGAVPHHVLAEPDVVSGEFGSVNGIRTRPDGSLLVADRIGGELVLVDLDAGTRTVVGGRGEGPGEYQTPTALWPLPGDSTLLVDSGNNRLTVLAPDLSFGATQPMIEMDPEDGIRILMPRAVDGDGRIYVEGAVIMGTGHEGESDSDSTAILRVPRDDRSAETAARLAPRVQLGVEMRGDADNMMVIRRRSPYSPSDSWGVAPDGGVVVARASGYRVDWIQTDGSVRRGAPVAYDPVPVGQAEKEAWMAGERSSSVQGSAIFVRGSGGGAPPGPGIGGGVPRNITVTGGGDDVDDYDWPEELPAFTGRILVDPQGRAWLRRHQPAGAPWLYDIFTPDAEHAATVETANGHTVAGFGEGVVYLTFKDEVDLAYIARHRLPAS